MNKVLADYSLRKIWNVLACVPVLIRKEGEAKHKRRKPNNDPPGAPRHVRSNVRVLPRRRRSAAR
jgi:hypothetical protein